MRRMRLRVVAAVLLYATLPLGASYAQKPIWNDGTALHDAMLHDPAAPVIGDPNGDVTIVEFFDYQCPFCRKMHGELGKLLADDPKIRLVLKDWPIFGDASVQAARVALASRWQGKFAAVHGALLATRGPLDEARIREVARTAGVDLRQLDRDLAERGSEIEALLARNARQASALELDGTPSFFVGPFAAFGFIEPEGLRQFVADARAHAKAAERPKP